MNNIFKQNTLKISNSFEVITDLLNSDNVITQLCNDRQACCIML